MTEDPCARREEIAGVTLHPPQACYVVEGLSFGAASIELNPAGKYNRDVVTLLLTSESVAISTAGGGTSAPRVSMFLDRGRESTVCTELSPDTLHDGLLPLIVGHNLYGQDGGLVRKDLLSDPESPARTVLSALQAALADKIVRRPYGFTEYLCAACIESITEAARRPFAEELSKIEQQRKIATGWADKVRLDALEREVQKRMLVPTRRTGTGCACPHIPWFREAIRVLFERYPELGWVSLGQIEPTRGLQPPRFVIAHEVFNGMVGRWLVKRSTDNPYDDRRWYERLTGRRRYNSRKHPSDFVDALPPERRDGVRFAASAWGIDEPPAALVTRSDALIEGRVDTGLSGDDRFDVSVVLPDALLAEPLSSAPVAMKRAGAKPLVAPPAQPPPPAPAPPRKPAQPAVVPPEPQASVSEVSAEALDASGIDQAMVTGLLRLGLLEEIRPGVYVKGPGRAIPVPRNFRVKRSRQS